MQNTEKSIVQLRRYSDSEPGIVADIISLVSEYFQWGNALSIKTCGFNFDIENMMKSFLTELPLYDRNDTRLYVLYMRNQAIGLGGYKRNNKTTAEIKRVFVKESFRRQGFGRSLLLRLITDAKKYNFDRMILETAKFMTEADALYRQIGFVETPNYLGVETPLEFQSIIHCMEIALHDQSRSFNGDRN